MASTDTSAALLPARRTRTVQVAQTIVLLAAVAMLSFTTGRFSTSWQQAPISTSSIRGTLLTLHKPLKFHTAASNDTGAGRVRIFVGVLSASANAQKRDAVRQTWGAHPALVRVVFIINRPRTADLLDSIRKEAMAKDDIIILGHVHEGYDNITHQSLEVFRAAYTHHGSITHVLKCDDDSYVHVDRMLQFLAEQPFDYSWAGSIGTSFEPIRDPGSKWYVSKAEWPEDHSNITWSNGPGYVLTYDLVRLLATGGVVKCSPGPLFKLEDIAVGSWLTCLQKEQNITINLARARINTVGCAADDLVSHYMKPSQMLCMHAAMGRCCN